MRVAIAVESSKLLWLFLAVFACLLPWMFWPISLFSQAFLFGEAEAIIA